MDESILFAYPRQVNNGAGFRSSGPYNCGMNATVRPIRSFVLRQGRFSPAQQRAYEDLMPRLGIPYGPAPLNFESVFGRNVPTVLEIGFGMGETTARIAAESPERNFVGIEVHTPGVGALLRRLEEHGLENVRVIQHDAVEVVRDMIPPASLAGIHVFFPDPWPKKRHHKRRLLQKEFVELLASRLVPGGYLHAATDWEEYAEQILEVFSSVESLRNTAANYAERPAWRPQTKFETRGLKLGHGVRDLVFTRT
jgi:tRNA (guanine-N7-)-methyltransferase